MLCEVFGSNKFYIMSVRFVELLRYGSSLLIGFQDVPFLPSLASCLSHFLNIVIKVETLGPPPVLCLWLGVNMGMLHMKYF